MFQHNLDVVETWTHPFSIHRMIKTDPTLSKLAVKDVRFVEMWIVKAQEIGTRTGWVYNMYLNL